MKAEERMKKVLAGFCGCGLFGDIVREGAAEIRAAERTAAEAMRERCAREVERREVYDGISHHIRALPLEAPDGD